MTSGWTKHRVNRRRQLASLIHDAKLRKLDEIPQMIPGETAMNLDDPFSDKGVIQPPGSTLQMKRGLSFTIIALLGLLASIAMAMDNNWSGAAFGCVAAGCLFVMAIV
jgi:hypothetical protein